MLVPGELLTEGKGKRIYATEDPDKAIVYFKDEAMAYHGLKRGRILGKGEINNAICKHIFELLAAHGYRREGEYYRAEQPNEDTVVLFCHFGVTCVLLSRLLGISPMPLWQGTCSLPTSVTILNTEERREGIASFRMTAFGDTSHLYAAGREPSFSGRFCETYENWEQRHD